MALLRAERLVRRYAGRTIVDIESIELRRGEILAVLGPNGAGKSTLFRLLALLEMPDSGRILLDDQPVTAGDTRSMRRLGTVFQRPYLFAGSVAFNVGWGLRQHGLPKTERRRRVAMALESAGLSALADADGARLSGGERQRVALARAAAIRPEVLLLDEPMASLDVTLKRAFREDLERTVRSSAAAAILITHDPADAFGMADRIAIMEHGSIVQVGVPEDLMLAPATPFAAEFTGAELLLDGVVEADEGGLMTVRVGAAAVVVAAATGSGPAVGRHVHVAYRPEDVVLARPSHAGLTSAINRFDLRVEAVIPAGALVRVRLVGGVSLAALVTRRSAHALGLESGVEAVAQIKATALRVFPAS
jgi:molybdopterin-binding protein